MNNLKKKLFAATAMLVVSAVMLGSSTFAWYTLSTAPEIKGVTFNMSANQNLEIALDDGYTTGEKPATGTDKSVDTASQNAAAGGVQGSTTENYYTWGNLIDLTKAIENVTGGTPTVNKIALKPVKYEETANATANPSKKGDLFYPQYGDDGRIDTMAKLNQIFKDAINTGASAASRDGGFAVYGQKDDATGNMNSSYDAFSVTYWLRSNKATSVTLTSEGKKRAESSEDTTTDSPADPNDIVGGGSFIEAATNEDATKLATLINEGKLVIQIDDLSGATPNTLGYAKAGAVSGVNIPLTLMTQINGTSTANITLELNKGKKLIAYVYLDGKTITNKDALLTDLNGIKLNLQFVDTNGTDGSGAPDNSQSIKDAIDVA